MVICDQCGQVSRSRKDGAACSSLPFGSCDGTMRDATPAAAQAYERLERQVEDEAARQYDEAETWRHPRERW